MNEVYRALFSADWHFSNRLPHAVRDPETLISDRLDDQMRIWTVMLERAQQLSIEHLWVLGDLIDSDRLDAVVHKAVIGALTHAARMGLKVHLVPGNHEMHDSAGVHYILEGLATVPGVTVYTMVPPEPIVVAEGVRFWPMPALPEERAREVVREIDRKADPKHDFLLIHQQIIGARSGPTWAAPTGLAHDDFKHFGHVLAGDFHRPQVFKGGRYLGSPMQLKFKDAAGPEDRRGFWSGKFAVADGAARLQLQLNPVRTSEFFEYTWNGADFGIVPGGSGTGDYVTQPGYPGNQVRAGDYVRLRVSGERAMVDAAREPARVAQAGLLEAGIRQVQIDLDVTAQVRSRSVAAPVVGEQLDWNQLLETYTKSVDTSGLDTKRLLQIGQDALEGAQHD